MRYTDLKIDKLIYTSRILAIVEVFVLTMRVHGISSNYKKYSQKASLNDQRWLIFEIKRSLIKQVILELSVFCSADIS